MPAKKGWGEIIGGGLGEGIGSGFQALANMKMQDYAARQAQALQHEEQKYQQAERSKGLASLFSPEQAQYISMLDPKSQQEIIKQKLQQPKESSYLKAVREMMGGQPSETPGEANKQELVSGQQPISTQPASNGLGTAAEGLSERQLTELVKLKQTQDKAKAKMSDTEWNKAKYYDERSLEDYTAAKGQSKAAYENNMRFDRMRELIEKGEMPPPLFASFIEGVGKGTFGAFDLTAILGADAEEFKKLSSDMVKGIKDIYGARITNNDLEQFLKTIPTLIQTNEGKLKLIHNLELLNQGNIEYFSIMKKVVEDNDGMRPKNFDSLVEKTWRPKQKELAKEFKKGIHTIEKPLQLNFTQQDREKQAKIAKHKEQKDMKKVMKERRGVISQTLFESPL